jgi:uncharacterized protein YndB with AHSA1/START domain
MNATTAQVSVMVDAPIGEVWRALTDPDAIREYFMGAEVVTDWTVGHPILFRGEWNGTSFEDKGEILSFDPQREMSYTHWSPLSGTADVADNYHVVRIELNDPGSRCTEVTLTQANLNGTVTDADRANRAEYEKTWSGMLAGLKKVAERRATTR